MPIPLAAISAGVGIASGLKSLFGGGGGKQRKDMAKRIAAFRRQLAEYRGAKPVGYLTGEDYGQAERTRGQFAGAGRAATTRNMAEAMVRLRQTGATGSAPGLVQRAQERAREEEGATRLAGIRQAENDLYNRFSSREQWEQHKLDQWINAESGLLGTELGLDEAAARRADASQAGFFGDLQEFLPTLVGFFGGGGAVGTSGSAGRDTSTTINRPTYRPEAVPKGV